MSQKTHPIRVKRGLAAATPSRYMKRVKRGWERGWGYTIFTLIAEGFKGAASAPTRAAGTLFTICHRVLFLLFSQAIPELMYAL